MTLYCHAQHGCEVYYYGTLTVMIIEGDFITMRYAPTTCDDVVNRSLWEGQ